MKTMLQSIYSSVKSRVIACSSSVTKSFDCSPTRGVWQGESLSPFLFEMFVNYIDEHLRRTGSTGIDLGIVKLFILIYADGGLYSQNWHLDALDFLFQTVLY